MSHVRFHEAECIDSQSSHLFGFDDFWGDSLDARWNVSTVGGGSVAVVDGIEGGAVRLSALTNVTSDRADINWNTIRTLKALKHLCFEVRFRQSSTNNVTIYIGLSNTGTQHMDFRCEGGGANYRIRTNNEGAGNNFDSGIPLTTDWIRLRMECHTHGGNHVHYYVNGVETSNSPISTLIPFDSDDPLQIWITLLTKDTNPKTLDIDYVTWRQDI